MAPTKDTGGLEELEQGMFEQRRSNYIEQDLLEENKIQALGNEVSNLIKDLENSELNKNEIQT